MSGIKSKHVALCLAAIGAALMLSQLHAGPEGNAAKPTLWEALFKEVEIQRSKVDIDPTAPDTGIETGFFFAYGHYVPPPYAIEVRGCSTFVNGVRVYPEQELRELEPDSVPSATLRDEYWEVGNHLDSIALAVGFGYWDDIGRGVTPAEAEWKAESLLLADTLVDTVLHPGDGVLELKGKPAMLRGKLTKMIARMIVFRDLSPDRFVKTVVSESTKIGVAETWAQTIRLILNSGRCTIETQGYSASKGRAHAWELARTMVRTELTDRELWYTLAKFCGYGEAMSFIANRDAAKAGWQELLRRLEAEDENR